MKKIKISFALIAAALGGVSCSGFLDTKIDTFITPEVLEDNRHTLWNLANAFYTPMQSGFYALDNNMFAAASDEAQRTQGSGNTYILYNGMLNPDNVTKITNIYKQCYEGIRAANYFIAFAEANGERLLKQNRDIVRESLQYEKDKRNLAWYMAEAHAARAYYYGELIKRFGGVPIVETTFMESGNQMKEQKTYDEVVEYIVAEIDAHFDALQYSWTDHPDGVGTSTGRFDQKAALAVKSRVLLYAASALNNPSDDVAKWERAAKAAHDVIEYMNYTMPPNRNYGEYFVGNNAALSKESIFLIRLAANNDIEKANYPIATPGGNSGIVPTHNLVDSYELLTSAGTNPGFYTARDPRLYATVVIDGSNWNGRTIDQAPGGSDDMAKPNASKTGYYLKKFLKDNLNLAQGESDVHIWVAFRYAEILLNYAEAMNKAYGEVTVPAGYTLSALDALEQVRQSASTDLPPVDVANFYNVVKHERRVELAFEDHRYWDLLRWKDAENVYGSPITGVKVTKEGGVNKYVPVNVSTRSFSPHNYMMPFPRNEIVNSKGTMNQNQGYN